MKLVLDGASTKVHSIHLISNVPLIPSLFFVDGVESTCIHSFQNMLPPTIWHGPYFGREAPNWKNWEVYLVTANNVVSPAMRVVHREQPAFAQLSLHCKVRTSLVYTCTDLHSSLVDMHFHVSLASSPLYYTCSCFNLIQIWRNPSVFRLSVPLFLYINICLRPFVRAHAPFVTLC